MPGFQTTNSSCHKLPHLQHQRAARANPEWRNQNQFDYSTTSDGIWKTSSKLAQANSIAWRLIPTKTAPFSVFFPLLRTVHALKFPRGRIGNSERAVDESLPLISQGSIALPTAQSGARGGNVGQYWPCAAPGSWSFPCSRRRVHDTPNEARSGNNRQRDRDDGDAKPRHPLRCLHSDWSGRDLVNPYPERHAHRL